MCREMGSSYSGHMCEVLGEIATGRRGGELSSDMDEIQRRELVKGKYGRRNEDGKREKLKKEPPHETGWKKWWLSGAWRRLGRNSGGNVDFLHIDRLQMLVAFDEYGEHNIH